METLTKRPEKLYGATYKIRWVGPEGDVSYYVTINHIKDEKGMRLFEIFIISQDVTHAPWMAALTRMISAIFRRGGDIRFVMEELQEIHDVVGPQVIGNTQERSLLALIGKAIEKYLEDIGYEVENSPLTSGVVEAHSQQPYTLDEQPSFEQVRKLDKEGGPS